MTAINIKTKGVIRRDPALDNEALLSAFDELVKATGATINLDPDQAKRIDKIRQDAQAKKPKK